MMSLLSMILVLIGFYGLLTNRHVLKMLVAINVLQIGINVFIISLGYGDGRIAPILTRLNMSSSLSFVDPLPQALVLTAIVIGVGTTALGLAIARKIYDQHGTYDLTEIKGVE
ncbi:MAG: cation:proton antiporter [Firmicutes bacterium HGW-Firmicutes-5]|jgi:multicomponent Na+:H+ antiporter subunit C|nr:MAG: cation:proton antiporter [Firmicutes bacterium HGW-Firmicutes-5]